MPAGWVRVLEIGGTHVTAARVETDRWQVRDRSRTPLDSHGRAAQVIATLAAAAATLADTVPSPWAIATPDPFDYARGIALFRDVGKFDDLYGLDLAGALRAAITPAPTSLGFVHDTEAFLLGEWTAGAATGADRCVALTLGTGVGSAFLADGRLVNDRLSVPPGGRIHRCRLDGAPLEDVVSRRAIRARYAAASDDSEADVREIAARARAGDATARSVLDRAFHAAGRALAPCVRAFGADLIVVGGSMARSWDLLQAPLLAGLECAGAAVEVRPARHPVDAPLIGAARHVVPTLREAIRR